VDRCGNHRAVEPGEFHLRFSSSRHELDSGNGFTEFRVQEMQQEDGKVRRIEVKNMAFESADAGMRRG
jgi:hypothetical protein